MSGPRPAARPRPMGGFNSGMGHFNEHLDEDAMQQAMQQHALGQQAGGAPPAGAGSDGAALGGLGGASAPAPREIGTFQEELITRPVHDVAEGLRSLFDLRAVLGINPETDDPQTQAQKKQMLQRFDQMTEAEQAVAQEEYQRRLKEKQAQEQEKEAQRQQAAQQQAQTLEVPTGRQHGAQSPTGSKKQQAAQRIQQDRKTLSNAKGVN